MKKTTLVIVDDHKLVREMFHELLSYNDEIDIIGEAGLLEEAIELISLKKPDIALLDINLGLQSGFDALPFLRTSSPDTKIIAVSMHANPNYAKNMIQLGARGYITKNSSRLEMFKGIKEVINGKTYVCDEIKDIITELSFNDVQSKELTVREHQIIKLLASGLTSKEIGETLGIAIKTVEVHRYNLLKKLSLKNTAAVVNYVHNSKLYTNAAL